MFVTVQKIRRRLAGEEGFTLIELLTVCLILAILCLIAVPSYLGYETRAEEVAAQTNVSSAVPAAESYYTGTGNNSYTAISGSALATIAPGINSAVKAVAVNSGGGYCVQDTNGLYTYDYIGGTATPLGGWSLGTIQQATCLTAAGSAAT
jgi:prepilin-type N-terminal cleavage/methylation domain-containing protein